MFLRKTESETIGTPLSATVDHLSCFLSGKILVNRPVYKACRDTITVDARQQSAYV